MLQVGMDARLEELHFEPHNCFKNLADRRGLLNTTVYVPDIGDVIRSL